MKLGREERPAVPKCWDKGVGPPCLRVELCDGSHYLFPYTRLQFVRFESEATQDRLRLLMDTHEICISGKNLRELGVAFQKLTVDWVRELPARYTAMANDAGPWIHSIKVKEIQPADFPG